MNTVDSNHYVARRGAPLSLVLAGLIAIGCALLLAGVSFSSIGSALASDSDVMIRFASSPVRAMFGGSIGALGVLWTTAGSAWFGRLALTRGRLNHQADG